MPKEIAPSRDLPDVRFRVLIAGRANAGKTSILQRVCDTTESPKTYKVTANGWGRETREEFGLHATSERGEHNISDELEFSNHKGYVFHDSRGLESGGVGELEKIQSFVCERSQRKRLQDRLHAIWYCIPMDDNRPKLNINPLYDICKDKNIHVPIIVVFTKFEAFRHDIRLDLEDSNKEENVDLEDECKRRFKAEYLSQLYEGPKFVCLEGMDKPNARCDELIETTMRALDPATVMLMLLAVQTENLELNVKSLVPWIFKSTLPQKVGTEDIARRCLVGFPTIWYRLLVRKGRDLDLDDPLQRLKRDVLLFVVVEERDDLDDDTKAFLDSFYKFADNAGPPSLSSFGLFPQSVNTAPAAFTTIALILVLRYVALTLANNQITCQDALQQACTLYSHSEWGAKVYEWLATPARTAEEIAVFVNCIPWNMS